MLSDREIDQAAAQLQEIRLQSDRYMKNQTEVLESYHQLIEDYQRLKSDYEEERSNRERYKQLARGPISHIARCVNAGFSLTHHRL